MDTNKNSKNTPVGPVGEFCGDFDENSDVAQYVKRKFELAGLEITDQDAVNIANIHIDFQTLGFYGFLDVIMLFMMSDVTKDFSDLAELVNG